MKNLVFIFVSCMFFQINVNAGQYFENDKISFSYPDEAEILETNEKETLVYHLRCKKSTIMITLSLSPRSEAALKPMADSIFAKMKESMTRSGVENVKFEQSDLIILKNKIVPKKTTRT